MSSPSTDSAAWSIPFRSSSIPWPAIAGGLGGLVGNAGVDQLLGGLERLRHLLLVGLADRVVQALGEERLGLLGLLGRVAHAVEHLVELLALLFGPLADLLPLVGLAEGALGRSSPRPRAAR